MEFKNRKAQYPGRVKLVKVAGSTDLYDMTLADGNRLTKFGTTTFSYNGAGRRVSKGNITFTYDSDGRLIKQSDGLEFIYDHSGVAGVKYNGNARIY